jgi:ubiquinone biosynthesis protein
VSQTETPLIGRAAKIAAVLGRYGMRGSSATPEQLRAALEELGPTFAKLGQVLSTRPDLLPPEVIAELQTLQDRVAPMTEQEVVGVMEEELGVPWEDVFESIEPEPLAAGTIAQVHRARLESGEDVVVKVQRPTAEEAILRDLALLELFAEKAGRRRVLGSIVDFPTVVEHLSTSLRRELDFRQEAGHVARLRGALEPFSRLDVPGVHERLSTGRLLVLEYIDGLPVRDAPEGAARREAARQLLEGFYRHVLVDGFFHADPHPGNMRWADGRIYFLDLGMVGELPPDTRELVLLLLLAFWQSDTRFLAEVLLMLGGRPAADLDLAGLERDLEELLAKYRTAKLAEIELGPILQGMTEIAAHHGIRLPASLALTAKALSQMQLTAAVLDPELDPFSVIGRFLLGDISAASGAPATSSGSTTTSRSCSCAGPGSSRRWSRCSARGPARSSRSISAARHHSNRRFARRPAESGSPSRAGRRSSPPGRRPPGTSPRGFRARSVRQEALWSSCCSPTCSGATSSKRAACAR